MNITRIHLGIALILSFNLSYAEDRFVDAATITKSLSGTISENDSIHQQDTAGSKDLQVVPGVPMRTRGITAGPSSTSQGFSPVSANQYFAPAQQESYEAPQNAPSIDLVIPFQYDSDVLTHQAVKQLNELAAALNGSTLQSSGFEIIGHTDASGSAHYNQGLSERRANAVKDFLTQAHGVEPTRLTTAGMGEHNLILPSAPTSGVNRRVEIRRIGGYVR
jgi:outer membrane protein OmpA-like peptidoglycan-associated protein